MAIAPGRTIAELDTIVEALPHARRSLFERIFDIHVSHGRLLPPAEMEPWIIKQFGSLDATLEQKIVRVTNQITLEGVLFNWLRSSRPMWKAPSLDLEAELEKNAPADPLRDPYHGTPEDVFGRIEGKYCVTASNIAKFDGFHGLVVFREPHPLAWTREALHDYIDTGMRWAEAANAIDADAQYYLYIWNCLWRAGASLLHGHAQVMLGKGMHYAAVEQLRRAALLYQAQYRANYFNDLYEAHADIDCAFSRGDVRVIANLVPKKENEVLLFAPSLSDDLKDRIYDVLACFRDRIGVTSFNLVMYMPPLGDTEENWEGFPVVVRIVDRGDPMARTADIGAMELYAASVVSSDPFRLAAALDDAVGG
ncbi:MAG TPA: hypothetical protein VKV26_25090 [Dehalococcoidia bacterium]|nr:hypothetical protein [Dehalococcoidia bacterium]